MRKFAHFVRRVEFSVSWRAACSPRAQPLAGADASDGRCQTGHPGARQLPACANRRIFAYGKGGKARPGPSKKDAIWHGFPVKRDDAATPTNGSHQHAQICARSLVTRLAIADLSRPNKDANLHDLPVKRDEATRLTYGNNQHAPIGAPSQEHAAELLKVWPPCWQTPLFPAGDVNWDVN